MSDYTLNFAGLTIPLVTLGASDSLALQKAGEAAASAAAAEQFSRGIPPSLVVIGDSITASNSDNTANLHADSWATHLVLNSGGKLRMVRNSGIGGQTSAQMLARFATDVVAYLPNGGWCGILAGTNDTDGVTDTYANIEAMILLAKAARIKPFLGSVPPANMAAISDLPRPQLRRRSRAERLQRQPIATRSRRLILWARRFALLPRPGWSHRERPARAR